MSSSISKVALGSALVLVFSLGLLAPTTASSNRTYAAQCVKAAYKPHNIVFACGDGGFYVRKLSWRHWSPRWAVAHGVFHENNCRPDCARGTFYRREGILLLSGRLWCSKIGKFVFRRVSIGYTRPSPSKSLRWTHSFKEFCPF